jgi:hypothetical protein
MDPRHYPHPQIPGHMIVVDLDSRTPLTELEADALNNAVGYMTDARHKLTEDIRKTTQRLVLSGEKINGQVKE